MITITLETQDRLYAGTAQIPPLGSLPDAVQTSDGFYVLRDAGDPDGGKPPIYRTGVLHVLHDSDVTPKELSDTPDEPDAVMEYPVSDYDLVSEDDGLDKPGDGEPIPKAALVESLPMDTPDEPGAVPDTTELDTTDSPGSVPEPAVEPAFATGDEDTLPTIVARPSSAETDLATAAEKTAGEGQKEEDPAE